MQNKFDTLVPDTIFAAAERALERRFSGVLLPLPSYINRVYEMESCRRERFILKFYRPAAGAATPCSKSISSPSNAKRRRFPSSPRSGWRTEPRSAKRRTGSILPSSPSGGGAPSKRERTNSGSGSAPCSPASTPSEPPARRRTGRSSPRGKTPCRKQRGC